VDGFFESRSACELHWCGYGPHPKPARCWPAGGAAHRRGSAGQTTARALKFRAESGGSPDPGVAGAGYWAGAPQVWAAISVSRGPPPKAAGGLMARAWFDTGRPRHLMPDALVHTLRAKDTNRAPAVGENIEPGPPWKNALVATRWWSSIVCRTRPSPVGGR